MYNFGMRLFLFKYEGMIHPMNRYEITCIIQIIVFFRLWNMFIFIVPGFLFPKSL